LGPERVAKIIKHMAFNNKVGPGKKSKIDKCRAYVFLEFGVINKNNYNSNWKNSLGFRNMLEKFS